MVRTPALELLAAGTHRASQILATIALLYVPGPATASRVEEILQREISIPPAPAPVTTRFKPLEFERGNVVSSPIGTSGAAIAAPLELTESDRPTTTAEKVIGEIRGWRSLPADWDGEGAAVPVAASLEEAVSFVSLLSPHNISIPEPMLLSSGRAGLYWNDGGMYADLEFTGDGRVTYYIEHSTGGKHKGVVPFDSDSMPPVFSTLLLA